MDRLLGLRLTIFERPYAGGHQGLERNHLGIVDLTADGQQLAYDLVREQHALTVAGMENCNSALSGTLKQICIYTFRGWAWAYTTPPQPFARVPNLAPTPRFAKLSWRSTGLAPSMP